MSIFYAKLRITRGLRELVLLLFFNFAFCKFGGLLLQKPRAITPPVPLSGEIRQIVVRFARLDSKAIGLVK